MTHALRVGTRGSPLALAQTEEVLGHLRVLHPRASFETVVIRTHGDEAAPQDLGTSLDGKRAFTKRIEDALLASRIDFAVHSLKDLPTDPIEGVALAAIPPRADPRDALVTQDGRPIEELPAGARVGTSSLRRRAQLKALWPELDVRELRGNLGTRLQRLDAKDYDAVVVAAAGLHRLDLDGRAASPFSPDIMTPAPGQGALAVEAREADRETLGVLQALDDPDARRTTEVERTLSARMGGGCNVPFGALATLDAGEVDLRAVVASPDGRRIVRARARGDVSRWRHAVDTAWSTLIEGGGRDLFAEVG